MRLYRFTGRDRHGHVVVGLVAAPGVLDVPRALGVSTGEELEEVRLEDVPLAPCRLLRPVSVLSLRRCLRPDTPKEGEVREPIEADASHLSLLEVFRVPEDLCLFQGGVPPPSAPAASLGDPARPSPPSAPAASLGDPARPSLPPAPADPPGGPQRLPPRSATASALLAALERLPPLEPAPRPCASSAPPGPPGSEGLPHRGIDPRCSPRTASPPGRPESRERQPRSPRLCDEDRLSLYARLSTMAGAGIPIARALAALASHPDGKAPACVLESLLTSVRAGRSLSDGMSRLPEAFGSADVALVAAGERSGTLAPILERLMARQERRVSRRRAMLAALVQPCVVALLALLMLAGMGHLLGHQVLALLDQCAAPVELHARVLLVLVDLPAHPLACLALLALGGVLCRSAAARATSPEGRRRLERVVLGLPWAGPAVRHLEAAHACDTLAVLLEAGVPLLEALELARRACRARLAADALGGVKRSVMAGESLGRALSSAGFLPRAVVSLVGAGEDGGRLGEMLWRAARFSDEEGSAALERLHAVLEPLVLVGLGLAVGGLIMVVLGPLYRAIASMA